MDFTQKPYKPTLYPTGRGRGRVEVEDHREENFKLETTLTIPKTEEEEEELSEANPEEQNLTGAQLKESPGKTPKQRV